MITEEQRKERINYIGSSDAAAVLGLSPWSSPVKVWAEKCGILTPEDISDKFHIRHGNKMEPVVAEMYMEETGEKVHKVNETIYHPKYPFIAANIDRRVVGKRKGLECKATSSYRAKEWAGGEDEMPVEVVIQCLHQMAVTGYEEWDAAALIGNSHIAIKTIKRDEAAIQKLVQAEVEFWQTFVLPKVMPDHFTPHDKETLDKLYPEGQENKTIPLDDTDAAEIELIQGMCADYKNLGDQIETKKNRMKARLGEAEIGVTEKYKIYWTNIRVKRLDTDAFKVAHPQIYADFRKEKLERRFLIKPLQSNGKVA
jgi:putative phage-type endonuclease